MPRAPGPAQIAADAGHPVPMVPTRHQLLITEPIEGVRPEHAILRIIDAAVYGRTSWDGFLLGGYETDPLQFDDDALKPPFEMRDTPLDFSVLQRPGRPGRRHAAGASPRRPVRVHRGGVPTMTVDGQHLVGPVPGAEGMWIAAGCNVAGLSISPVIGELLGEWIVEGQTAEDLSLMSLTRFGPEWRDPARVREAAAHHYAHLLPVHDLMPRLSVNLDFLFAEVPFLERFERAAAAGFTSVECHWSWRGQA